MFLRIPECLFCYTLYYFISALVRETDDGQLSVIFILSVHIPKFIIDCVNFENNVYFIFWCIARYGV